MASPVSAPTLPEPNAIPASLLNVCFGLFVINAVFFPAAFSAHWWIFDAKGLGIPTDFVNVWSAGKLVLDGHPALAYDWDIQKQVQVAVLGQSYDGNFAWHYPPPATSQTAVQRSRGHARDRWTAVWLVAGGGVSGGADEHAGWAEWFPHRIADRGHALSDADTAGAGRHLSRAAQLQAAIRTVVSAGADRGLAVDGVLHGGRYGGRGGVAVVARLRHRELAGFLSLDADVLAGLPDRRPCPLGQDAEHLRAGTIFRRHRAVGVGVPVDHERRGRGAAGADVAQPHQLSIEGSGARGRHLADHALSV